MESLNNYNLALLYPKLGKHSCSHQHCQMDIQGPVELQWLTKVHQHQNPKSVKLRHIDQQHPLHETKDK